MGVAREHATVCHAHPKMASGGSLPSVQQDYETLREVREELVSKIAASTADENVLIAKARDKGLIQSIQASAAVAPGHQSKREKAEQLVNQVLEGVRSDETKTEDFLQLLVECSFADVAAYLREMLREGAKRRDEDGKASPRDPSPPLRPGSGYGHLPKLEAASNRDSAFTEMGEEDNRGDDAICVTHTQHQLATDDTASGASFKRLTTGVVVVEQDHTDNLTVGSDSPVSAVADTQPHSEGPPAVSGSSVPVLPEVKQMEQENKDLQAQLAQKTSNEDSLQKELKKVQAEKEESEKKLAKTRMELETKDSQIKQLKAKIERLESERQTERENNAAEKERYAGEIAMLKAQLQEKEAEYGKDQITLRQKIHDLELEIEKMNTREKEMKWRIAEEEKKVLMENQKVLMESQKVFQEKEKCAKLQVTLAEENSKRNVEEVQKLQQEIGRIKFEHQNSLNEIEKMRVNNATENEQLKEELSTLRRRGRRKCTCCTIL